LFWLAQFTEEFLQIVLVDWESQPATSFTAFPEEAVTFESAVPKPTKV